MSMAPSSTPARPHRLAVVLAGGAARGAYEVGVVRYLVEEVARALGRDVPIDLLCGTSVGAINVCGLAAFADLGRERGRKLEQHWHGLRIADVVRPDTREIFEMLRALIGLPSKVRATDTRRGGVFDPAGLERVIGHHIPFARIGEHLRAGRLAALSVSATHVATGRTVVFVQRAEPGLPYWGNDPTTLGRAVEIRAEHALASAAIPFLFPAVRIDGQFFSDGGLRQNVPLSPARRLGADSLVVVNPKRLPPATATPLAEQQENERAFPGPLFLLGKTLNALLLDRIDSDLDRLERINSLLDAGTRVCGPSFIDNVNRDMGLDAQRGVRPLRAVLIRSSHDIGELAAEFVRAPGFERRCGRLLGRLMRRLAEGEARREADFLSYLLFDGDFARQLIELGYQDARERHEELCTLVSDHCAAAAAK